MYKYLLLAVFLASTCISSWAAQEFYVALSPKEGCKIVNEKPDGTKAIMVGSAPYATREEAKTAKKAAPECAPPKGKSDENPQ
jgi:hypothetical protein